MDIESSDESVTDIISEIISQGRKYNINIHQRSFLGRCFHERYNKK